MLPLPNRSPLIADDCIDPTFGTGGVKITPAHDRVDYEIGRAARPGRSRLSLAPMAP